MTKGVLLAGAASLVLAGGAGATYHPNVSAAEFKCMAATSKGASKFVGAKSKCATKCQQGARKGTNPFTDCDPPFAGATATCIFDSLKGAEAKYAAAIRKKCVESTYGTKVDCPECHAGGDCSNAGHASAWVAYLEPQVDTFGPLVWPLAARETTDKVQQKCMDTVAKTLTKMVGAVNKCCDKCFSAAAKAKNGGEATCQAPAPTDAATATCLNDSLKGAIGKAAAGVDKACAADGILGYPDGATWATTAYTAVAGNVPLTYCASPSGAFVAD